MNTELFAIALAVSSASFEIPPADGTDIVVQGTRPNPDEVVCEKITAVGSRVATRKICATRRDWDEKRRADREATEDLVRQSLFSNVGPD